MTDMEELHSLLLREPPWGMAHVSLDESNLDDSGVELLLTFARGANRPDLMRLGYMLLGLSIAERRELADAALAKLALAKAAP